ncbi:acyltransferase [Curtobacterium sp. MCPF17_002]|uniref:acyltransferase family protein n=1 Tax=Curtobacterium sp. MCPF17_002 TaxID=2175645 RepID=UPI000DA8B860|nr:acyltransferase [Curtobacterium sp. MCPF17_002]WIB78909.1 acyltransferase [Curtobacterium sp. MCPF17_002]
MLSTSTVPDQLETRSRRVDRSVAVDLVRVIGVVAIVAGHTWDQRHFAQAGLYTWHVPVFFVLTGYLWKAGRSTRDELGRRSRTLLVPYLSWLVLVTLVWTTFRALMGDDLDTRTLALLPLGGDWISRPYSAFWFVTCLFVAAVLMRWLERLHPFMPWFVAGVGIAWCIVDRYPISHIPESAGTAMPALAFLLAGMMLRRARDTIDRPLAVGLVLLVPAWWLGWSGALETLNVKGGNLGTPLLSVLMACAISCGMLLVAESLEHFIPRWGRSVIFTVAACAIPMILLHTLSLAITERLGYPSSKWTFLIAYFAPLLVALVLRLTPAKRILF